MNDTQQTQRPDRPKLAVDGLGRRDYDPLLYRPTQLVEAIDGLNAITEAHLEQYRELGFLAVNHAFDAKQVGAAIQCMLDAVADPPEGFKGFQYEAGTTEDVESMSPEQRLDRVRKFMHFVDFMPALKAMCEDQPMLAIVRQLMNDRTPRLFQDMALLKPPHGREKPWHQDQAYFAIRLGEPVVGVWIALDQATPENGCMHFIPGSHRDGPVIHFARRDWQICDTQVRTDDVVAVPLEPGGLVFFDGLVHHGTPHNLTHQRRRSLQYHFCPDDAIFDDEAKRQELFGNEGKNVEC